MALKGNTNAEKIWNFLTGKGIPPFGVAGLMGNLEAESGLKPENLENLCEKRLKEAGKPYCTDILYTQAVDNGTISRAEFLNPLPGKQYGYGLAQWTSGGRKAGLYDLVKSKGVSISDLETQLEFLYKELTTDFKAVLNALKTAASVRAASDTVLTKFERPKDQGESVKKYRAECGQKYYNQFAAASAPAAPPASGKIRIGHASISENGTTSGKPGDQTGKEVCIREWYSKPWDYVAIHPDPAVREKHAATVEAVCLNDNVGYNWFGDFDRNSLYKLAKAVNFDIPKVGPCNCDCSSLQNVAAVASGSGATYGSNGWTTQTMKAALQALGYKIITSAAYLTSSAYCVRGAIYVKAGSHTVAGLDNGSKADQMLSAAGIAASTGNDKKTDSKPPASGSSKKPAAPTYEVGKTYTAQVELNVRKAAGTNAAKVGHAGLTANAKANDKDKDGAIDAGTRVTCKEVKKIGDDIWIKIPSGWIAAYYSGKVYVK